jgi:hypothetical protein
VALLQHFKRSNLAPKNFNHFMHGLKSAILAIFQKGLCSVSAALKNLTGFEKIGSYEFLAMQEGKIRETPLRFNLVK